MFGTISFTARTVGLNNLNRFLFRSEGPVMLRLSRPTVGLLTTVALLSGVSAWQTWTDGERTAPLTALAEWVEDRPSDKRGAGCPRNRDPRCHRTAGSDYDGRSRGPSVVGRGSGAPARACCTVPTFSGKRFREVNPGATDEERWRRMLIERVKLRLRDDKEHAQTVVARLEAEIHGQRGRDSLPPIIYP